MDRAILRFGEYELDLGRRELRCAGAAVELQRTPLQVLLYLGEHRDRTVPRQELLDAIWPDAVVVEETLTRALTEVRRAVGDQGDAQRVIRTHKGIGYRFAAPVDVTWEGAAHGSEGVPGAKGASNSDGLPSRAASRRVRVTALGAAAGLLALATAAAWLRAPGDQAPASPPYGIAVLPIAHLGSLGADRELADGLTEQIAHALAQNGYPVVARTTSAQWRERAADVRELGRALGVSHVLEGSVRRGAGRVRVTLQLVATDSGKHVWSETFDASESDPLAVADHVANRVAVGVYHSVWADASALGPTPEAVRIRDLIVRSRQLYLDYRMQDHLAAAELLLRLAPDRDPYLRVRSDTHAWMSLAWSNLYSVLGAKSFEEAGAPLLSHAEAAVAIAPDSALAHMALSRALSSHWRWAEAEREMRSACALSPRDGRTCGSIQFWVCAALGCMDEQLEGARMWARAFPADGAAVSAPAMTLMHLGRLEEAEPIAKRSEELGFPPFALAKIQWRLGKREEAVATLRRQLARRGLPAAVRELDRLRDAGPEAVWRWRAELRTLAEPVAGISMAAREFLAGATHAELGDLEAALNALERSVAAHEPGMELHGLDYIFDPIRDTPRFRALVEQIGLMAYHARYAQRRRLEPSISAP